MYLVPFKFCLSELSSLLVTEHVINHNTRRNFRNGELL